jgi:hypothetical protein
LTRAARFIDNKASQAEKLALVQREDTPKALANFSPGLELATTLGRTRAKEFNAESVDGIALANASSVGSGLVREPRVEATLGYS